MKVILMILFVWFLIPVSGQNTEKYINVGDTTINLADVDLEMGLMYYKQTYTDNNYSYDTDKRVFRNSLNTHYFEVFDTVMFNANDIDGSPMSEIRYFQDGQILFVKSFKDYFTSKCFIHPSGRFALIKVHNMDECKLLLIDSQGVEIEEFVSDCEIYYHSKYNDKFIIWDSSIDSVNKYFSIDSSMTKRLVEIKGILPSYMSLSPHGNYINVFKDRIQYIYDANFKLLWSEPVVNGTISFFDDEQRYIYRDQISKYLIVNTVKTRDNIKKISSIKFGDINIAIDQYEVIDNDLVLYGETTDHKIIQFLDKNYTVLNTEELALNTITWYFKPKWRNGRYVIEDVKTR